MSVKARGDWLFRRHQQHTSFWTPCWSRMLFHRVSSLPLIQAAQKSTITFGNDYHPEEVLREAGKGPQHPFCCIMYSSHSSLLTGQTSPQRTPFPVLFTSAWHIWKSYVQMLIVHLSSAAGEQTDLPGISTPHAGTSSVTELSISKWNISCNTFTVQFIRYTCEHLISTN